MKKAYDISDDSKKSKRLFEDFNLYGCNLNIAAKEVIDDIKKYGRTNHSKTIQIKK